MIGKRHRHVVSCFLFTLHLLPKSNLKNRRALAPVSHSKLVCTVGFSIRV